MVLKYWGRTCSESAFSSTMMKDVPSSDQCTMCDQRSSFNILHKKWGKERQ